MNIESISLSERIATLQKHISDTDLIVPVIGAFSAGIAPETALATELHYNTSEYIEAVRENGSVEKFSVNDTEILKDRANWGQIL